MIEDHKDYLIFQSIFTKGCFSIQLSSGLIAMLKLIMALQNFYSCPHSQKMAICSFWWSSVEVINKLFMYIDIKNDVKSLKYPEKYENIFSFLATQYWWLPLVSEKKKKRVPSLSPIQGYPQLNNFEWEVYRGVQRNS